MSRSLESLEKENDDSKVSEQAHCILRGRGSEGGITSTRSWTGHIRPNKVQCVKYFCNVFKLLMVYTKSTTDYFVVALKSLIVSGAPNEDIVQNHLT